MGVHDLASGADEATTQSCTVASAAEAMSLNMRDMADSTEEVSSNVKNVALAIDEMRTSIDSVAADAEKAANVAGNASSVRQLPIVGAKSQQIDVVVVQLAGAVAGR